MDYGDPHQVESYDSRHSIGWITEGLLDRAGFRILSSHLDEGVVARYLCTKETGIAG